MRSAIIIFWTGIAEGLAADLTQELQNQNLIMIVQTARRAFVIRDIKVSFSCLSSN